MEGSIVIQTLISGMQVKTLEWSRVARTKHTETNTKKRVDQDVGILL